MKKEKEEANKEIRLLSKAFELFTEKGVKNTSIQEIVDNANVAKGTFYLYFKDKYDIRNMLIAHKASQLFQNAENDLLKTDITDLVDEIIFIADNIINQLCTNQSLLMFISKNLSWGIFKSSITNTSENDINFNNIYQRILNHKDYTFKDPEVMLFMIIELTSSTCYSSILYDEPVSIDKLKPYLYETIRSIIKQHVCSEPEH